MSKFKLKDKVIFTPFLSLGKGEVTYVYNKDKNEEQIYQITFYKNDIDEIVLLAHESRLMLRERMRHICPECGLDFPDDIIAEHMMNIHNLARNKSHDVQAEEELMEMDRMQRLKAEQYDRICEMMFMACGIVEDGDSIKYIIEPETVCDELLKIIITDDNVNREHVVETKKKRMKEITGW